jgi:hypothetical protein
MRERGTEQGEFRWWDGWVLELGLGLGLARDLRPCACILLFSDEFDRRLECACAVGMRTGTNPGGVRSHYSLCGCWSILRKWLFGDWVESTMMDS